MERQAERAALLLKKTDPHMSMSFGTIHEAGSQAHNSGKWAGHSPQIVVHDVSMSKDTNSFDKLAQDNLYYSANLERKDLDDDKHSSVLSLN